MRMILSVALLAACADTTEVWPAAEAESVLPEVEPSALHVAPPPGEPLVLDATDVIPGQLTTLTVTNADPGESVFFIRSSGGVGNPGACPAALGGHCLDINGPAVVAGNTTANANGVATLRFTVPASVPNGLTVWFEAAAARGGVDAVSSNAVERVLGQVSPWSHTIAVDGDGADWFGADEAFATTSAGNTSTFVTWDDVNLYLGFVHPDIATGGAEHWTVVYFSDGGPGSFTGVTQGTQTPDLSFAATHAIRRKADGSYDGLLEWDGANWAETPFWLGTEGSAAVEGGDLLELAIPRQLFANDAIMLHSSFVFEGAGYESSFGGTPDTAFTEGAYDPDFADHLAFDMSAAESPVAQN